MFSIPPNLYPSIPLHNGLVSEDRIGFSPLPDVFSELADEDAGPLDHLAFTARMEVLLGQSVGLAGCAVGAMVNPECAIQDILQTVVVLRGHLESAMRLWRQWLAQQEPVTRSHDVTESPEI